MKELEKVGVITPRDLASHSLKHEALWFDRIVLSPEYTETSYSDLLSEDDMQERQANREWLRNQGVLLEPSDILPARIVTELNGSHMSMDMLAFDAFAKPILDGKTVCDEDHMARLKKRRCENQDLSRYLVARELRRLGSHAVPIFYSSPRVSPGSKDTTTAVAVVLKQLPVPDESVPWEQILDFRKDSDVRESYHALVNWVQRVSRLTGNLREMEEELEHLLQEYGDCYRRGKARIMKAAIATLFSVVLPNMYHPNAFGIAVSGLSGLYSLRQVFIDSRELGNDLFGREVAYICDAKRAFTDMQ